MNDNMEPIFVFSNPSYKNRSGKVLLQYIEDGGRRKNCRSTRLKGLAKKAHELVLLCGGQCILHYVDEKGSTYMYTSNPDVWDKYEEQTKYSQDPTITFPSVKSVAQLNGEGLQTKLCTRSGNTWKVKVTTETTVMDEEGQGNVLNVSPAPQNPTPSKKSQSGDFNYLPSVVSTPRTLFVQEQQENAIVPKYGTISNADLEGLGILLDPEAAVQIAQLTDINSPPEESLGVLPSIATPPLNLAAVSATLLVPPSQTATTTPVVTDIPSKNLMPMSVPLPGPTSHITPTPAIMTATPPVDLTPMSAVLPVPPSDTVPSTPVMAATLPMNLTPMSATLSVSPSSHPVPTTPVMTTTLSQNLTPMSATLSVPPIHTARKPPSVPKTKQTESRIESKNRIKLHLKDLLKGATSSTPTPTPATTPTPLPMAAAAPSSSTPSSTPVISPVPSLITTGEKTNKRATKRRKAGGRKGKVQDTKVVKRSVKENVKNCEVCGIQFHEEDDTESHELGRWMGCEICDTWIHRKCAEYSMEDMQNKTWYCIAHRQRSND